MTPTSISTTPATRRFADGADGGVCGDTRGGPQPGPAPQHGGVNLLSRGLAAQPLVYLPDEGHEPVDHGLRALQLRGAAGGQRLPDAGRRAVRLLRDRLGLSPHSHGTLARCGAPDSRLARAITGCAAVGSLDRRRRAATVSATSNAWCRC